jgi:type IV secretory pathway VirJ component
MQFNLIRFIIHLPGVLPLFGLAMALSSLAPLRAAEETLDHTFFGKLVIERPTGNPKGLVLLLSGETGWDATLKSITRTIGGLDYLVAGIDSAAYLARLDDGTAACADPAADLEQLGSYVADHYHLPQSQTPILVGYGAGAALAYAALAQARTGPFHAAISLEFCPRLTLRKPLCQGHQPLSTMLPYSQGLQLLPIRPLKTGWFVFQADPACDSTEVARWVAQIGSAKLVAVPAQNAEPTPWLSQMTALLQWLDPRIAKQVQPDADLSGVPLIEVPSASNEHGEWLAVMLSGDGGWAALDRAVAAELAKQGIAVVGWDSLSYFWGAKTPEQAGADLEQVVQHYLKLWGKDKALLIGYSFGADVLPFMANRLSPALRERIKLVAFLGLGPTASFEFHLTDWLGSSSAAGLPIPPEVSQLNWTQRLCIFGDQETDSACPNLTKAGVTVIKVPGDHHFAEDYSGIARRIVEQLVNRGNP